MRLTSWPIPLYADCPLCEVKRGTMCVDVATRKQRRHVHEERKVPGREAKRELAMKNAALRAAGIDPRLSKNRYKARRKKE